MSEPSGNDLLSIDQLVTEYGIKKPTIYSWNRRHSGPDYVRLHGRCQYRRRDVDAWLAERNGGGR